MSSEAVTVSVSLDDGDRTRRVLLFRIPDGMSQDELFHHGWAVDGLKALKIIEVGDLFKTQQDIIDWLHGVHDLEVTFGTNQ